MKAWIAIRGQEGGQAIVLKYFGKMMKRKSHTKLVHAGNYVAEVDIELIDSEEGWSPYLSVEDAKKLDEVRLELRKGDLKAASRLSRVFTLTPVSV